MGITHQNQVIFYLTDGKYLSTDVPRATGNISTLWPLNQGGNLVSIGHCVPSRGLMRSFLIITCISARLQYGCQKLTCLQGGHEIAT